MTQNVDIEGLAALRERVQAMGGRARNWARNTEGRLHGYVLLRNKERFETQNLSEGKRWAAYGSEPRYERLKKAVLGDLTVLRWKGGKERLYPSLTRPSHPEHVHNVRRNRVEIGTDVPYAARLLRQGTNHLGEPRPARDFVTMGTKSRERLVQLLTIYIVRGQDNGNEWRKRP